LESNTPESDVAADGVAERGVTDNRSEFEYQDIRNS
jgi:hypothetical protein